MLVFASHRAMTSEDRTNSQINLRTKTQRIRWSFQRTLHTCIWFNYGGRARDQTLWSTRPTGKWKGNSEDLISISCCSRKMIGPTSTWRLDRAPAGRYDKARRPSVVCSRSPVRPYDVHTFGTTYVRDKS